MLFSQVPESIDLRRRKASPKRTNQQTISKSKSNSNFFFKKKMEVQLLASSKMRSRHTKLPTKPKPHFVKISQKPQTSGPAQQHARRPRNIRAADGIIVSGAVTQDRGFMPTPLLWLGCVIGRYPRGTCPGCDHDIDSWHPLCTVHYPRSMGVGQMGLHTTTATTTLRALEQTLTPEGILIYKLHDLLKNPSLQYFRPVSFRSEMLFSCHRR